MSGSSSGARIRAMLICARWWAEAMVVRITEPERVRKFLLIGVSVQRQ
jgi:hypothetical protein